MEKGTHGFSSIVLCVSLNKFFKNNVLNTSTNLEYPPDTDELIIHYIQQKRNIRVKRKLFINFPSSMCHSNAGLAINVKTALNTK